MTHMKYIIMVGALLIASCKKETAVAPQDDTSLPVVAQENLIPVVIDLQSGVENNNIIVYCNQQISFQANLSDYMSLAGPIARFSTYLKHDTNSIKVRWRLLTSSNGLLYKIDSTKCVIGSSQKYYIGIEIISDSLRVKLQETPFLYL